MKRISNFNYVNWILHRLDDVEVCKTIMGDIVLRRWNADSTVTTISQHGKDEVAGYNALVALKGLPAGYCLATAK
jgi:hypothetical protein